MARRALSQAFRSAWLAAWVITSQCGRLQSDPADRDSIRAASSLPGRPDTSSRRIWSSTGEEADLPASANLDPPLGRPVEARISGRPSCRPGTRAGLPGNHPAWSAAGVQHASTAWLRRPHHRQSWSRLLRRAGRHDAAATDTRKTVGPAGPAQPGSALTIRHAYGRLAPARAALGQGLGGLVKRLSLAAPWR